jgi:hypothetical protein
VLKELGENVNLEDNFNKLREIQGLIEESVSLDALVKQSMMVSINVEVNLQQVDHREKFLEELGRVENADNLLLETGRLKCLGKMLERARATSGVEELKQAYSNKIIDYEIQMKVAAIRRYVFDGQGELGLKSWLDLQIDHKLLVPVEFSIGVGFGPLPSITKGKCSKLKMADQK